MCDEEAKEPGEGTLGQATKNERWIEMGLQNVKQRLRKLEDAEVMRHHAKSCRRSRMRFWTRVVGIWCGLVLAGSAITIIVMRVAAWWP